MYIKYPNDKNIYSDNLEQKLILLKKLSKVNEGANKYYNALTCTPSYYSENNIYSNQNIIDILKIENKLNLLNDIIPSKMLINYHYNFTVLKLKEHNDEPLPLNDFELFGIIKECKLYGLPKQINEQTIKTILTQIIPSMDMKKNIELIHQMTKNTPKTYNKRSKK